MAVFIQTTCLIFLLGMAFSWPFPLISEQRIPLTFVHTSFEEGSPSSPLSIFDEMNRIMASMHQRFEHIFGRPTFPQDFYYDDYDLVGNDYDNLNLASNLINNENKLLVVDLTDIRKQLDAVEPICTTITDSPTTISPRKSRRKKLPTTQTITCIKQLFINGQKHFSEEVTTTDDKGVVINHSKSYGAISADTNQIQQ